MSAPLSQSTIFVHIVMLLLLYALFIPALWLPLFNVAIFYPDRQHYDLALDIARIEKQFGAKYENVYFPAQNKQTLNGWLFALPSASKVILVCHGNAGNIAYRLPLATLLLSCGASVFLYDYQGYGESAGRPSLSNVCADAIAAFDYLVEVRKLRPAEIVGYGESIGAGVICELAKKRSLSALILQSGFFSLAAAGRDFYPWLRLYPEWFFPEPRMDTAIFLSKPHPPLLLIHGMKDEVLSYHYSARLMKKALPPKQLLLLPNTGHNDVTDNPEVILGLRSFLAELP